MRAAVLVLLAEQPRHGYDLIRSIEERSGGVWTPSAGSIYPTLQVLEDEGLLTIDNVDGRKTASLTDAGRAWVEEHPHEAHSVFEQPEGAGRAFALRHEMRAVAEAAMHIARHSEQPELAEQAAQVLAQTRKDLYRLLAEDRA